MRIISGEHKGMSIIVPKGLPARPTTDRCKESLFNILETRMTISETTVLDLFSGTGNIAYEFASRGAAKVIAVEKDFKSYKFISNQIQKYNFKQLKVNKRDVFRFLETEEEQFDIIFADPPYNFKELKKLVLLIFERKLLKDMGLFIMEHSEKTDFSEIENFSEKRKYGQSSLSFFKNY
jgi:16S rRNA (guanine966-N2)-methyltransferase